MNLTNKKYNLLFFIIGITLLKFNSLSSQISVKGILVDDNRNGIVGATIVERKDFSNGQINGVISDLYGNFSILISETSKIEISALGFRDTLIMACDMLIDTINMQPIPYDTNINVCCPYDQTTINIGYLGDINRMPLGFTFYYFKPFMFGKKVMISTNLTYKTDFKSNQDFVLILGKSDIIKKVKYRLSSTFYFHLRDLTTNENHIRINDYELILRNYIFNFLYLSGGIMLRDDFNSNYNIVGIIGIEASIWKTLSHLNADVRYIDRDYEYSIAFYQRLAKNIRILNSFQVGLEFNNYIQYNELNMILRYYLR